MTITLALLRTYVTVAECGSLIHAADQLGRTPSAVSMALSQLEEEIGSKLFSGERKSTLTPLGRFTLEQAEQLVLQFDEGIRSIKAFARSEIGFISLACVPSVADQILAPVIRDFHDQWPKVEIEIRDADSASVIKAVRAGRVQFGIASPGQDLQGLRSTALFEDSLGLVCASSDPLVKQSKITSTGEIVDNLFQKRKLLINSITQSMEFPERGSQPQSSGVTAHNVTSVLALVRAGVGMTILPRLSVPVTDRQLSFIPLDNLDRHRRVSLIERSGNSLSPATTTLIDLLTKRINQLAQSSAYLTSTDHG